MATLAVNITGRRVLSRWWLQSHKVAEHPEPVLVGHAALLAPEWGRAEVRNMGLDRDPGQLSLALLNGGRPLL